MFVGYSGHFDVFPARLLCKVRRVPLVFDAFLSLYDSLVLDRDSLDKDGRMFRTKGIVHTIKDGVVVENARLMDEVEKMVAKSKQSVPAANAVTERRRSRRSSASIPSWSSWTCRFPSWMGSASSVP